MSDVFNLELRNIEKLGNTDKSVLYIGKRLKSLEVLYRRANGFMSIELSSKAENVCKFFESRFGSTKNIRINCDDKVFEDTIKEIDDFLEMFYK